MEDYRVTQTGDEIQEIFNQSPVDTADIAELKEAATSLDGRLESVEGKIPAGASSENPLTDKQYVDSSIASASATFRGTYNEVTDLELTTEATHAEIGEALASVIDTADSNDYCFVQIPTADATPTEIESIERYKFVTGTGWQYEYTLNNSGFTADQWAAINSGITSGLVAKLTDLPTNAELETLLNGKANTADVYTKSETYNKTELDAQLGAKANSADVYEKSQTYTKQEVDALITTPEVQYVTVTATSGTTSVTDVLPATGAANTIYRVGSWDGTQYATGVYSEYAWNGTTYILLDVKNYGFATGSDFDNPTTAQRELVTTVGSVLDGISEGVFDLTAKTGDSYATLADALTAANTSIPTNKKKGGMSIKYVQTSDNKYVQYMLKKQTWTVDVRCWEKVNLEKEVNVLNEQINKINITSATAGVTPYIFKAGVTYHIKNNGNVVTISHRDSPDGESEDIVSIATYGEIDYTPTTDGLYLRYGAACNLDIYIKSSVYDYGKHAYDKVENADTNPIINSEELITSGAVFESTQLHSSIAKYAIQGEGFVDGLYWYVDNGKIAVVTNSNTMAGCFEKIPVSEGDEVRFHRKSANNYNLIVTDALGNVLDSYPSAAYARLEGKYTVPEGAAYLYINTLKTNKDKSFCFVNVQIIPETEKRLDIEEECLMLPYAPIAQKDKYYDVNGVLQSRSGLKAFEISNLEGIYKIRCIVTFSSYGYYGFVVNNTFIPQQWVPAEHAGENYGYVTMRVPEGATKFLCSWTSAFVAHNDVSLMQDIKTKIVPATDLVNSINVSYSIKNDWVVGRYNMSNGEINTSNTAFKAVEISLNNFYAKTLTFKKTYTGDSTYACYGFVINGEWQGYTGIAATAEPYEATVNVPSGATVFKVCWNMNQATSSDLVVNAVGYKFSNEPKPNQPIYQFEPDFNLSRIPQMTCPSETAIHAITLAELYAMYDALMVAYPNYITKVDCDAEVQAALEITAPSYMEGCPIYMYKFIPKMGGNSINAEYSTRPKVLITSMHPQERLGVYATYEMMKMICENWTNDVNAEQMRSLIDIYVLPAPWSWNFANNARVNYNGINPNRQFPTKRWKESGQGTTNWSGTAPLSEYEAKVVNYYLLQIKPNACLDVHTSGNDDVGHMGILLTTSYDQILIDLCSIIARTTSNRAIQDNPNFPSDPNTCIYGVYAEGIGPESGYFWEYAYEQGCQYAALSEESPYSKWNNGVFGSTIVEQYTDGILREQVQYIFNTILRLTKAACVQFYKG